MVWLWDQEVCIGDIFIKGLIKRPLRLSRYYFLPSESVLNRSIILSYSKRALAALKYVGLISYQVSHLIGDLHLSGVCKCL